MKEATGGENEMKNAFGSAKNFFALEAKMMLLAVLVIKICSTNQHRLLFSLST